MSLLPDGKLRAVVSLLVSLLKGYGPIAVYAFGSRASGEARPDSDLDLAVLLPSGTRLPVTERLAIVDRLQEIAGVEVDLVVLNEARLPLRFEIIRHGRVLWESDPDARTDAEDIIVRDYLDFRPFLERSFRDMLDDSPPGAAEEACPMFNLSLVADRAQTVRNSLARLRELSTLTLDEFRAVPDNYAIAEHHLRRALQALLDLGRHLAVKSGWGNPSHYREIFDLLERGGVIPPELADKGRGLAGYRNRLVHDYAVVTADELWEILRTRLADVTELLRRLMEHAESERQT
ncbi:MAG TPA: hypothetical protein DGR79_06185 [Clostridiales bacterium]|mgnify:CR=1 FL=1|nr:hypothetical protein [Clostridiales bacterium]